MKISVLVFLLLNTMNVLAETLKVGYFEVRPHFFYNEKTKKPQGAAITYFKNAIKEMGYDIEWIGPLPFPRMIEMGKAKFT